MDQRPLLLDEPLLAEERFLDLAEQLLQCQTVADLSSAALPWIARLVGSEGSFLFTAHLCPPGDQFHHHGLTHHEAAQAHALCRDLLGSPSGTMKGGLTELEGLPVIVSGYRLVPFEVGGEVRGVVGLKAPGSTRFTGETLLPRLSRFMAQAVATVLERMRSARQIAYFNTYLTVSSLMGKSLGLHKLLETALYFCTEAVGAQEASVLFLDEDRRNFMFFRTEGASRSVLEGDAFPADRGIAGDVLKARKSEIVHDVQNDPRFYGRFDTKSGVLTRNMIAVPLVAENEPVGVLEVINKVGGASFSEEERLLLHFIAEEIALAVRNARLFELAVDSYCKQRQGQPSCKGCRRPLGSWTPCVKYREQSEP